MDVPETKYAKTADGVHIAYQVCGSGPLDLVLVNSSQGRQLRMSHRDRGGHEYVNHSVFQSLAGWRGRMALM
jgi:hypothetical protein